MRYTLPTLIFLVFLLMNANAQNCLPRPDHIVILIEEDEGASGVICSTCSSFAPYLNTLANDSNAAVFTNMYAITHPDQPNHLDMFSGSEQDDSSAIGDDSLPGTPFTTPNLAQQLLSAGLSFKTYSQDLPYVGCLDIYSPTGSYARKHNPASNWQGTGLNQLPDSLNQPFTDFPDSSNFDWLPTICYVVPDEDSDMHNGIGEGPIMTGDYWFHTYLGSLLPWALQHNTLLIVTWDEDYGGFYGNNIPTIFYGPMVKGGTYNQQANLFSQLRTLEDMYGLSAYGGYLGAAADVSPITFCWAPTLAITQVADSFCSGSTYNFNGRTLTLPGVYYDTVNSTGCSDSIVRLTLSSFTPPSPGNISPNGSTAICPGDSVVLSITPVNGSTYQWQSNGSDIGGATQTSYAARQSGSYVVIVTNALGCSATTQPVVVTVANNLTPGVNISSLTSDELCQGQTATFQAAPTNGGSQPVFQWRVNGINTGTDSSTFSTSQLQTDDVVTCFLTSNSSCVSPDTASSNAITVTVNPSVNPSISISANSANVCQGSADTIRALIANGGNSPGYTWLLNGQQVNDYGSSYITDSLHSTDAIACVLLSSALCARPDTLTSNIISVNVYPAPSAVITPPDTAYACNGDSVMLSAPPGNPGYLWNTHATTQSIYAQYAGQYAVTVTNINNCTAAAAPVTVVVSTSVTPAISISASAANVCQGNADTINTAVTNGGLSPVYSWLLNGQPLNNAGSNYVTDSLSSTDVVKCILVSSAGCASPDTVISNSLNVNVYPAPDAAINPSDTAYVCTGDSIKLSAPAGNPGYLWNTHATTQSVYVQYAGQYAVTVTSINNCTAASEPVIVIVNPQPNAPVISQSGDTLSSTAAVSYVWYLNNTPIAGAAGQQIIIMHNGGYAVQITDSNGCTNQSAEFTVSTLNIPGIEGGSACLLYPNPNKGNFTLEFPSNNLHLISVMDVTGRYIGTEQKALQIQSFDYSTLASGVYTIVVKDDFSVSTLRLLITK